MAERSSRYLHAAADRVMIQDLLARYAWEIDHGTPAAWAALFTADGVFEEERSWTRGKRSFAAGERPRCAGTSMPRIAEISTR